MSDFDERDHGEDKEELEKIDGQKKEADQHKAESEVRRKVNMRMSALSAAVLKARQGRCSNFPTILRYVTTVCTKRWIR